MSLKIDDPEGAGASDKCDDDGIVGMSGAFMGLMGEGSL